VVRGADGRPRDAAARRAAQAGGGGGALPDPALRAGDLPGRAAVLLRARLAGPRGEDPDVDPGDGGRAARPVRRRGPRTQREAGTMKRAQRSGPGGRAGNGSPAAPRTRRNGARAEAIGVDTGGTFTDFVAIVDHRAVAMKRRSTP